MKTLLIFVLSLFLPATCLNTDAESFFSDLYYSTYNVSDQGSPWLNSNLYSNWPDTRPDLKDNFELAVNYDLYKEAEEQYLFYDSFYSQAEEKQDQVIRSLIDDSTKNSVELELIRSYINLFEDYDKRQEDGILPLAYYIDSVKETRTTEEFSELLRTGLLFGNALAFFDITNSVMDEDTYGVAVYSALPFGTYPEDEDIEQTLADYCEYYTELLTSADYTAKEAEHLVEQLLSFMTELYMNCPQTEADSETDSENDSDTDSERKLQCAFEYSQLEELCKPLYDFATGLGYAAEEDGPEVWFEIPGYELFRALGEQYTDRNLDCFKTIFILAMAEYAQDYLDSVSVYEDLFESGYLYVLNNLSGAVDQVFLTFDFPEHIREIVTDLTDLYIAALEIRIEENTWLSEETKEKAIEKLNNLVSVVIYPDQWLDYSELLELVKQHDQNLLDAVLCRDDYYRAYKTQFLGKEIQRGNWVMSGTKSTEANAYYIPSENSINILAGILYDNLYSDESMESLLSTIGPTIGHEIIHGFDLEGSTYDSFGHPDNWWTEEDRALFEEKAQVIADQLSRIELFDSYYTDGNLVLNEMIADLGGTALTLDIAKYIEDFDYEEFFKSFARMWYSIAGTVEDARELYESDTHPADYIRANYVLQQFDKFYETFGIEEGDGMYLAPESRVAIW